ncbi:histone deacetylase 5 [Artemisia annua]|uniref:histone deacetylase n=1 Tax=Artemisia annua TaxID=35608 RepID=A0A2U1MLJ5_ARTAN|nr:histone deacetylase 5 [Artemisia annua]
MEFPLDQNNGNGAAKRRPVGLVYDERMCKHSTPQNESHPENPDRIRAVWDKLVSAGIPERCVVYKAKEVEDKYIAAVHSNNYINLIKTISSKKSVSQRNKVAAKYTSIYFNEGSSESANLAAGSVLDVAEKVAKGELNSAFAIVRPPGHHAEKSEAMGFCLYNNVAIAARFLLNNKELGINKILIVDWDIHHGNATQKIHENGSFFPGVDDGSHDMVGEGPGLGYNINVPWENGQCGDADYIAVWDHILIPVAKEYNPDIIIVSAGFDAAIDDPLGGCCVTPHGFAIMLKKLMEFSRGRIIMALEGGYNLNSLAKSVLACIEVLLEDKPIVKSCDMYPLKSTWDVIKVVRERLSTYWQILAKNLPENLTNRVTPQLQIYSSHSDNEYYTVPSKSLEDVSDDDFIKDDEPISQLSKKRRVDRGKEKIDPAIYMPEMPEVDSTHPVPTTEGICEPFPAKSTDKSSRADLDLPASAPKKTQPLGADFPKFVPTMDLKGDSPEKDAQSQTNFLNDIVPPARAAFSKSMSTSALGVRMDEALFNLISDFSELRRRAEAGDQGKGRVKEHEVQLARVTEDANPNQNQQRQVDVGLDAQATAIKADILKATERCTQLEKLLQTRDTELATKNKFLSKKDKQVEEYMKKVKGLEARLAKTVKEKDKALEEVSFLLSEKDKLMEGIPGICINLIRAPEYLVPVERVLDCAIHLGEHQASCALKEALPDVDPEVFVACDDHAEAKFIAASEKLDSPVFPYLEALVSNKHKTVDEILQIRPAAWKEATSSSKSGSSDEASLTD